MQDPGATEPLRVLVVCTGNSCRSIMAEALINARGRGRLLARSAGSRPTGHVHPLALQTLQQHGIDPGAPRSKSWDEFAGQAFDYVISVCDSAAAETCPVFAGGTARLHWSTPDPASVSGRPEEMQAAFERAFQMLDSHIAEQLL